MTRVHAPTLALVVREQASSTTGGPTWQLAAPAPGWF